eukprot:CAMPEP_0174910084 /NCGR_PEP_ID=MMETSP0167-20121228/71406_1 /TAXON_ID=38298 /ORGANISM="Rhodella maculata, Strain CCMP736" /LENGTH=42 /DNA_ID= /DNA_START= /DNA_END= /DNA_ORIENTATION=
MTGSRKGGHGWQAGASERTVHAVGAAGRERMNAEGGAECRDE